MSAPMTLEAALDKIAADNDLTSVAVGRMKVGECIVRTAIVHYDGFARDGIGCDSGQSDTSNIEALTRALAKAVANRTPLAAPVDALPTLEAA